MKYLKFLWWSFRLESTDPRVRAFSARRLGELKTSDAVGRLLHALADKNEEVRHAALDGLVNLFEHQVCPVGILNSLFRFNLHSVHENHRAIIALSHRDWPQFECLGLAANRTLESALVTISDENSWLFANEEIAKAVLRTLTVSGNEGTVPVLVRAMCAFVKRAIVLRQETRHESFVGFQVLQRLAEDIRHVLVTVLDRCAESMAADDLTAITRLRNPEFPFSGENPMTGEYCSGMMTLFDYSQPVSIASRELARRGGTG